MTQKHLLLIIKAAKIYHFARFEISDKLITVTVIDVNGNTLDAFNILPPARNISPANRASATSTPTLWESPFLSLDGATQKSSQWIVREQASGQIVFITNSNGMPAFDGVNLTRFTVPDGILQPGVQYQWQVVYKDSNGNTTQPSAPTSFKVVAIH
jgi:hypothetical protein